MATSPVFAIDWAQYLLSFGSVIALLLLLLWVLRRMQRAGGQLRNAQRLQVMETLSVGARQKICLVRWDGRELLVGVGPHQISVLSAPVGSMDPASAAAPAVSAAPVVASPNGASDAEFTEPSNSPFAASADPAQAPPSFAQALRRLLRP